jgi:hypothetical protein
MLRPIGPDDLMSLRAAATIGDAAFDLALLRVGILAPAELDEIRSLVLHPTACLEPTRNSDGHLIIDVVERGELIAKLHHDGQVSTFAGRMANH